jgi:benzoate/toluate 1,2-dioxygenase beta subunit
MLDPNLGEVSDFLYHECELLDSGQFSAWLDLFTPDAVYWVPLAQGQADPDSDFSLIYEDVLLLRMRIERMQHPAAHGMEPPPRTSRVIGNIRVRDGEKGQLEATARFTLFEAEDGRHRIFAGRYQFLLERRDQFRISRKRVDLVNSDAPFESIQVIF